MRSPCTRTASRTRASGVAASIPRCSRPGFRSAAYRAALGVGPDDLLVTYIGRLAREKNLGLLLEAWETLAPERGAAQLVLVGRGPLEEEIRRRELPGVFVSGLLQGEALSTAYASADVFAFPSASETFGNSLLEAMGSGLPPRSWRRPAACSSSPSMAANAWLVEPESTSAITDGLRRLLTDAGSDAGWPPARSLPPAHVTGTRSTISCSRTIRGRGRAGRDQGGVRQGGRAVSRSAVVLRGAVGGGEGGARGGSVSAGARDDGMRRIHDRSSTPPQPWRSIYS